MPTGVPAGPAVMRPHRAHEIVERAAPVRVLAQSEIEREPERRRRARNNSGSCSSSSSVERSAARPRAAPCGSCPRPSGTGARGSRAPRSALPTTRGGSRPSVARPVTLQHELLVVRRHALCQPQLARHVRRLEVERFERARPDAFDVPRVEELVGRGIEQEPRRIRRAWRCWSARCCCGAPSRLRPPRAGSRPGTCSAPASNGRYSPKIAASSETMRRSPSTYASSSGRLWRAAPGNRRARLGAARPPVHGRSRRTCRLTSIGLSDQVREIRCSERRTGPRSGTAGSPRASLNSAGGTMTTVIAAASSSPRTHMSAAGMLMCAWLESTAR